MVGARCQGIGKLPEEIKDKSIRIVAIGISYQMHGLVCVDKDLKVLRPSIIWCDSRAVDIGKAAFKKLGEDYSLQHLLNSPGNFTASKLRWVKENEQDLFARIHKVMLPGDFLAMKLTGELSPQRRAFRKECSGITSPNHLLLVCWSFMGYRHHCLRHRFQLFQCRAKYRKQAASTLGLKEGTPVSYRAGDQPNNAYSLNVLHPGETAATAGTSGVIYSVTDKNAFDTKSRVNTFIHVNDKKPSKRNGVLLCINGTGILNSWLRKQSSGIGTPYDYEHINTVAAEAPVGSDGLIVLPFGNGAEECWKTKT